METRSFRFRDSMSVSAVIVKPSIIGVSNVIAVLHQYGVPQRQVPCRRMVSIIEYKK